MTEPNPAAGRATPKPVRTWDIPNSVHAVVSHLMEENEALKTQNERLKREAEAPYQCYWRDKAWAAEKIASQFLDLLRAAGAPVQDDGDFGPLADWAAETNRLRKECETLNALVEKQQASLLEIIPRCDQLTRQIQEIDRRENYLQVTAERDQLRDQLRARVAELEAALTDNHIAIDDPSHDIGAIIASRDSLRALIADKLVPALRELIANIRSCNERDLLACDSDPRPPSSFSVLAETGEKALAQAQEVLK